MAETRDFHIGTVLSATLALVLPPGGIEDIHRLLDWTTGEALLAHQIPRAAEACKEPLLEQHPGLADVLPPPAGLDYSGLLAWVHTQSLRYGEYLPIAHMDPSRWKRIDPIQELLDMRATRRMTETTGD